jgi:hypothetical protein
MASRPRKDGSKVHYLQLARKVRCKETGKPKDIILCQLGREDQLDAEQLRRLAASLTRFADKKSGEPIQLELDADSAPQQVALKKCLTYGGSYVLDALWKRLGLPGVLSKLLRDRGFEVDVERILFALVANRALDPRSKLAIERWVGRRTYIEGLDEVAVHNLYRAMDFLIGNDEEVQKQVFFSVANLLNLEVDLLFFDTTSTYFETEEADEEEDGLRRYGHSKDHRPDLPQVVIGLAVTRDGIPVRCWVLPGNTADASVVDSVQRDLAGWQLGRVIWVVDRGFAGESQRVALQRGGGHVIVGERLRGSEAANHEALGRPGRFAEVRDNLQVKDVRVEHGGETRRFVVVRNPRQVERDRAQREKLLARLEAEIAPLNAGAAKRGGAHSRRVCELLSHRSMGRYVRQLKSGELRIDRGKVAEEAKLDGKYLLSTTDLSLPAEDVALGYKQLLEVEEAFRTLKSQLDLRPVYHRLPDRIRAHVLLCWLALLLVRVIERETGQSWAKVRDELEQIHLAQVKLAGGEAWLCSEVTSEQRAILSALSVSAPSQVHRMTATTNPR